MAASIQLKDAKGLLNQVRLLVPKTRAAVRTAVAQTALLIETDAKQNAPVDTGRLRSSIAADIAPNGLSATVGSNVTYAGPVEFGARGRAGKMFLTNAAEKNKGAFVANLKKAGLSIK